MKPVYVNPIKFERMRKHVWRGFMSDYPTLIQIGELHTGSRFSNVHFAKDNTEINATLSFWTIGNDELERMHQGKMLVVMEFGDFPFEVVDIVTAKNIRKKGYTDVTVRIRAKNRAGRFSLQCKKFLKRFMG